MIIILFYCYPALSQGPYVMKLGDPMPINLFSELAKKVSPAVVSVSVKSVVNYQFYGDPFFDLFEMPPPQAEAQAAGSGFIIDSSGLVLTNYHVIAQADSVTVHLNGTDGKDGEKHSAKLIGGDARTDIALLKIDSKRTDFPVAIFGDSKTAQMGDWVAAFGNPFGHEFSMSKGIISAIGRRLKDLNAFPFIQIDAIINPGNSGGPLVNTKGEVIGINTAIDARGPGIGFSIPTEYIKTILPQLKEHGKVIRGFIGIQMANLNRQAQAALGLQNTKGALIVGVQPGTPAAKAGVKLYDVITQFSDTKIENADDLAYAVKDFPIGKSAEITINRKGKPIKTKITVSEPPKEQPRRRR